jgi:hypothetical protein
MWHQAGVGAGPNRKIRTIQTWPVRTDTWPDGTPAQKCPRRTSTTGAPQVHPGRIRSAPAAPQRERLVERGPVVQEHRDAHQRVGHDELPVAVGTGAVDQHWQVHRAQHGREASSVRPGVRVRDQLRGPRPAHPAQPVCDKALLLVCVFNVADQASMIVMAFVAYRSSRSRYHTSASA